MPDYQTIHDRKSRIKHLTLRLLHEEYQVNHKAQAYSYAQFTHYYREYLQNIDLTMRLTRYPGEAMFVDYAGKLIPYRDIETGEEHLAQVFIAVLGWSALIFMHATRSQKIEDFIESHTQAINYFGGTPEVWVPDNLKSAVTKADRTNPVNQSYLDCARHYGAVVHRHASPNLGIKV